MNAQPIKAGEAYVAGSFDPSGLDKGLARGLRAVRRFGSTVAAIGKTLSVAAGTLFAPLALSVRTFTRVGAELKAMSDRTKVSVRTLSELRVAAQLSNAEFSDVEASLVRMQKVLLAAEQGSQGAVQALAELGLVVADLRGQAPDQQFALVADRLRSIDDPSRRAALALKVFGESGRQLLPMIEHLDRLRALAQKMGLTWEDPNAEAAAALSDKLDLLALMFENLKGRIGQALVPALLQLADRISDVVSQTTAWIAEHQSLVLTIGKTTLATGAAGAGLLAIGTALNTSATFVKNLRDLLQAGVVASFTAGIKSLGAALAWLAANPITLAIAALGGLAIALALPAPGGASELADVYDEIGVSIGKLTGKVELLNEALTETQKTQALARIDEEIARREQRLAKLEEEIKAQGAFDPTKNDMAELAKLLPLGAAEDERKALAALRAGRANVAGAKTVEDQAAASAAARVDAEAEAHRLKVAQEVAKLEDDLAEARIRASKTGLDQELALLELRRQQEMRRLEAEGTLTGGTHHQVNTLFGLQEGALRDEEARRLADEEAQRERQRATDVSAAFQESVDQIARLQIEATMDGLAKDKALLALEKQQRVRELAARGLLTEGLEQTIDQEFALRGQLLDQAAGERGIPGLGVSGTFEGELASLIFGSENEIPKEQLEVQRSMLSEQKKTNQKLDDAVGGIVLA